MSTTYSVKQGDTYETIARRVYGSEQGINALREANPDASEPLSQGLILVIPELVGAPQNRQPSAASSEQDEIALLIGGKRFRYWTEARITRSIDSMDTLEFVAPFESTDTDAKETFKPFSYKSLVLAIGGIPLFTGTLVGVNPSISPEGKTVGASGYSKPGVLNDCTLPAGGQLEYDNATLETIAAAVAAPFGVGVSFTESSGAAFERVAFSSDVKVLSVLTGLAKQRGFIISSTSTGKLLFEKAKKTGIASAVLIQGSSPLISITPTFSAQEYYSHVTGIESVLVGTQGSQYTVKNPNLAGIVRPFTFRSTDVEGGDLSQAVAAKAGRMLANAVTYRAEVQTWRKSTGELWQPGDFVKISAPDAMIYRPFIFMIRSVIFTASAAERTASLDLILPATFSGEIPEGLPWD